MYTEILHVILPELVWVRSTHLCAKLDLLKIKNQALYLYKAEGSTKLLPYILHRDRQHQALTNRRYFLYELYLASSH